MLVKSDTLVLKRRPLNPVACLDWESDDGVTLRPMTLTGQ